MILFKKLFVLIGILFISTSASLVFADSPADVTLENLRHKHKNQVGPLNVNASAEAMERYISESNPCLEVDSSSGEKIIRPSSKFSNLVEEIVDGLKCKANIQACKIFGKDSLSDRLQDADIIARQTARFAAQLLGTQDDNAFQKQQKLTQATENVFAAHRNRTRGNLLDKLSNGADLTMDELSQAFVTTFGARFFQTNVGAKQALILKIKAVASKEAKNATAAAIKKQELKALGAMLRGLNNVIEWDKLLKSAEESSPVIVQLKRFLQLEKAGAALGSKKFKKTMTNIGAKAGFAAGALSAFAVAFAFEAVPVVIRMSQGELDHGVVEKYDICSGAEAEMTPGTMDGGAYLGESPPYYDLWKAVFKNSGDNEKPSCNVYPVVNISKFEGLTKHEPQLTINIAKDPVLCKYLESTANSLKLDGGNNYESTMKATCPSGGPIPGPRKVKISFVNDLKSAKLLGSPINFEYHADENGTYSPVAIRNSVGHQPAEVQAMRIHFKGVKIGEDIRPKLSEDRSMHWRKQGDYQKCLLPRPILSLSICWNNFETMDSFDGLEVDDYGRSSEIDLCVGAPYVGANNICNKPLERKSSYNHLSSEKGYSDFHTGLKASERRKKMSVQQKQYGEYSKSVLNRSRFLNPAIKEVGFCCEHQNSGSWPSEELKDSCYNKYSIDQPDIISVENYETVQ